MRPGYVAVACPAVGRVAKLCCAQNTGMNRVVQEKVEAQLPDRSPVEDGTVSGRFRRRLRFIPAEEAIGVQDLAARGRMVPKGIVQPFLAPRLEDSPSERRAD